MQYNYTGLRRGVTEEEGAFRHIWCGDPCLPLSLFGSCRYYIYIEYLYIECSGKFRDYNNNNNNNSLQHI
jgi:hypothetical protein